MAKLTSIVSIFSFITILVFLSPFPARAHELEVEDESQFNYDELSGRGPSNWGNMRPDWVLCKTGTQQSPIDLCNQKVQNVTDLGILEISYRPSNATLRNRGHDIIVHLVGNSSYLQINGTRYELKQLHWHTPSEHTVNGKRFAIELHMLHQAPSGTMAVIGILYKIGRPDHFLSLLHKDLVAISENSSGIDRNIGVVNPNLITFDRTQYYRYIGSLTTPPCSSDILWTVVTEVKTISKEQIELLRVAVHDHSKNDVRPLQPLNNRLVQLNKNGPGPKI